VAKELAGVETGLADLEAKVLTAPLAELLPRALDLLDAKQLLLAERGTVVPILPPVPQAPPVPLEPKPVPPPAPAVPKTPRELLDALPAALTTCPSCGVPRTLIYAGKGNFVTLRCLSCTGSGPWRPWDSEIRERQPTDRLPADVVLEYDRDARAYKQVPTPAVPAAPPPPPAWDPPRPEQLVVQAQS
jgi:hypothetical protein